MEKHFTLPYEGGLIETDLPAGILHNYEKIWTDIYPESRQASIAVADLVVEAGLMTRDEVIAMGYRPCGNCHP